MHVAWGEVSSPRVSSEVMDAPAEPSSPPAVSSLGWEALQDSSSQSRRGGELPVHPLLGAGSRLPRGHQGCPRSPEAFKGNLMSRVPCGQLPGVQVSVLWEAGWC